MVDLSQIWMVSWLLTECFVLFIVIDFINYDFLLVSASVGLLCSMFHVPCLLSQCHVCFWDWDFWFLGFVSLPSMFSVSHL